MINFVIGLILILLLCTAGGYIIRSKKNGQKCIGCPSGCCCSKNGAANNGCTCKTAGPVSEE